ncbi:MAG: addiction module protein [Planctomycetaceae bacterium]|nr:addiction module protein [Planctomycetaceae bacterium]
MPTVIADYTKLSIPERLALIGEIWDSITAEGKAIPLTDEQKAELDRRMAEHDKNPDAAIPWEEIRRTADQPA